MAHYASSIRQAFYRNYKAGCTIVPFVRDDLFVDNIRIKNIGDVPHAYKVGRAFLPCDIQGYAPADREWAILGTGVSRYKFLPVKQAYYPPDLSLPTMPMPEVGLPGNFVLGKLDEQAVLAIGNRNHLFGAFLGLRTEHYQSHRRMLVRHLGQVEVDDLSLGTDPHTGEHFLVPVCAKRKNSGRRGILGWSQIRQDIEACRQLMPHLRVRPIGVIALRDRICLFEFAEGSGEEIVVVAERHYHWV